MKINKQRRKNNTSPFIAKKVFVNEIVAELSKPHYNTTFLIKNGIFIFSKIRTLILINLRDDYSFTSLKSSKKIHY